MPTWGRRQSYPVVVWTFTLLAFIFTVTALLRPLIPEPEPNPVASSRGEFMASASRQRVKWRTLEDRPFAEARRSDRLVLLLVGCAWNWQGRAFDKNVLTETEVAERMNRDFVPVRVDATLRPEWASGPFPLSAAERGADPGWYLVVLRPDGRPVAWLTRDDSKLKIDTPLFQSLLARCQALKGKPDPEVDRKYDEQRALEARFLVGDTATGGDLALYASKVVERADQQPVFGERGVFRWHPWELRLLAATGHLETAVSALRSALATRNVDWLYGGFFRTDADIGLEGLMYEKLATEQADMAAAVAILAQQSDDNALRLVAQRSFDSVFSEFVGHSTVSGFAYLESEALDRNRRYSLRPRVLAASFTPQDQEWLKARLGLQVRSNPAMVVQVLDLSDYVEHRDQYEAAFDRIRQVLKGPKPNTGGEDLLDVTGSVCARMIETARVLGDRPRLRQALGLFDRVKAFKAGPDGVMHSLKPTPEAVAYLGDYTAFADAAFQVYLATGDTETLDSGERVLARAETLFRQGRKGVVGTIPLVSVQPEVPWTALPSVVDGVKGSLVGDFVRLAQAFSLAYRGSARGEHWRETALKVVAQYSALTRSMNFRLGNLSLGMSLVGQDSALVVTGPDCVETALKLGPVAGERLVLPARGPVRPDLQSRKPGVWACNQDVVEGPFTLDQAKSATVP